MLFLTVLCVQWRVWRKCPHSVQGGGNGVQQVWVSLNSAELGGFVMKLSSAFIYGLDMWWQPRLTKSTAKIVISSKVLSSWGLFSRRKYICGQDQRSCLMHRRLFNNGPCFCCHACGETQDQENEESENSSGITILDFMLSSAQKRSFAWQPSRRHVYN